MVYSESWHIQNQSHIQNSGISKTLVHSEPETYSESWAIQNPGIFRTGGILRTLSNFNASLNFHLSLQKSLFYVKKYGGGVVEGRVIVHCDIHPRSFTAILLITFDFQYFLTKELCHNSYIMELILLKFLVQIRRP